MKLFAPGQGFPASQFSLERWTEYMVKLILDFTLKIADFRSKRNDFKDENKNSIKRIAGYGGSMP
jgi:hypothetical protein